MNNSVIALIRAYISRAAGCILILISIGLAISVLLAQGSTDKAKPPRPNCMDQWPPKDETQRKELRDAFEMALQDSATGSPEGEELRKKLLDPKRNFASPKAEIKKIVDKLYPKNGIVFPEDETIIFYEPEPTGSTGSGPSDKMIVPYKKNHCYTIVRLEDVGTTAATSKPDFGFHLMCCYDPW